MALGALPDDELAEVQEHLATCESCTVELAGSGKPSPCWAPCRQKLPRPRYAARSWRGLRSRRSCRRWWARPSPGHPLPPTRQPAPAETPADLPDNVVPIRRWFRRPGALIAAAIAAVVIGGGAVVAINQAGGPGTQVAQTPEECIARRPTRCKWLRPLAGRGLSPTRRRVAP